MPVAVDDHDSATPPSAAFSASNSEMSVGVAGLITVMSKQQTSAHAPATVTVRQTCTTSPCAAESGTSMLNGIEPTPPFAAAPTVPDCGNDGQFTLPPSDQL